MDNKLTKEQLIEITKGNMYVDSITAKGDIIYTDNFYKVLYTLITSGHKRVEAYELLGFPVEKLGENRAYLACNRAVEKAKKAETIPFIPTDGSIHSSQIGNLSQEELFNYYRSRTTYFELLEEMFKKKF